MRSCLPARRVALAGLFLVLFGFQCGQPVTAQMRGPEVKVDATLSPTRIAAGESTVLQITVETRGELTDQIETPRLEAGLEITGSQDFSQFHVSYPGGRSRVTRRDLIIRAHLPGQYIIPAVTVTVGGQSFRTQAKSLFVDRRTNQSGRIANEGVDEVRLRAWLDPDTVYVGQQVLLNAEALFPRDLRQRQSRPASYEAPTPSDFWIQDLPDAVAPGIRSIDGAVYETQTFRRAYFPLSPGRFALPPARLVYEIRRGFLYAPEARELVSDSLHLVVLPVPEAGRPSAFTGAVGRFSIDARLEPSTLSAGEAATLTVEIRGTGNVKALPPPKLGDPRGLELFPPSEDASVEIVNDELRGTKRFTWVVIPESAGLIDLPPVEYPFFDPEYRRFETAKSDPLTLRVNPEVTGGKTPGDSDLQPLAIAPLEPLGWVRTRAFAILQIVPLLALIAVFAVRRNSSRHLGSRARSQHRAAREESFEALHRAAVSAESDRVFYGDFAAAIRSALADLLGRPDLCTAPRSAMMDALRGSRLSSPVVADLDQLFAEIDHARFGRTPAEPSRRAAMVMRAKRLLDRVDQESWTARRATTAAAGLLMLAALGSLTPSGVTAQSASGAFAEGVAAFHDARYAEAISAFTTYLAAKPGDANAWYNLGNAYLREQRRGYAIWAWLHALELAPRHRSARQNLESVLPAEGLDRSAGPLTLPPDQTLAALAIIWWSGGLTVAALILFRPRAARWAAVFAGAALILVAAAALPARLAAPVAVTLADRNPVLAGPTPRSDTLATLPEGATVTILERRGDWWRVQSYDGREGWVESVLLAEV